MRGKGETIDWSGTVVLLTGASGLEGAWLAAVLLHLGARVFGVVHGPPARDSAYDLLGLRDRLVEISGGAPDRATALDLISAVRPEVVIHLVGPVASGVRGRVYGSETGLAGGPHLLDACLRLRVGRRVLIAASGCRFRPATAGHESLAPDRPVCRGQPGEVAVAAVGPIVLSYCSAHAGQRPLVCSSEVPLVTGPGDSRARHIVADLIRSGFRFLHVADAVSGYIRAVETLGGPAGRLGPGVPALHFTPGRFDRARPPLARSGGRAGAAGPPAGPRACAGGGHADGGRPADPPGAPDFDPSRAQPGWCPFYAPEDTLRELIDWHRPETTRGDRILFIHRAVTETVRRLAQMRRGGIAGRAGCSAAARPDPRGGR